MFRFQDYCHNSCRISSSEAGQRYTPREGCVSLPCFWAGYPAGVMAIILEPEHLVILRSVWQKNWTVVPHDKRHRNRSQLFNFHLFYMREVLFFTLLLFGVFFWVQMKLILVEKFSIFLNFYFIWSFLVTNKNDYFTGGEKKRRHYRELKNHFDYFLSWWQKTKIKDIQL